MGFFSIKFQVVKFIIFLLSPSVSQYELSVTYTGMTLSRSYKWNMTVVLEQKIGSGLFISELDIDSIC